MEPGGKSRQLASYRIGIFTTRKIDAGEEITYDYKFSGFDRGFTCLCGSANCRGTIGRVKQ